MLTLAAAPTALTPAAIAALPVAGVTLRVMPRHEIPAAVATGAADLGLVDGLAAPSDPLRLPDVAPLTTRGAGEAPVCVLLPAGHPLARRPGLRLGDLADALWIDAPDVGLPLTHLRAANDGRGFGALLADLRGVATPGTHSPTPGCARAGGAPTTPLLPPRRSVRRALSPPCATTAPTSAPSPSPPRAAA